MVCLGVKFGCDAEREAPRLLRTARDLGLHVVGVSFHVGSGCREDKAYRAAIRAARHVFDAAASLGIRGMKLLDVGGGYPGEPADKDVFLRMADAINSAVTEYFPSADVDVISEPGLYFVASAFTLAANVHSKREVRDDGGELKSVMYYINDGVYGSFFDVINRRRFRGEPLEPHDGAEVVPSSVWGPTCDGMDKVEDGVPLPQLELGSWLVYHNAGAYTVALACTFNSVPIPRVHSVVSMDTWLQLRDRAPFCDAHFVPSLATGRRHTSASLVDAPRRLSPAAQVPGPWPSQSADPPNLCRRGSIIDQTELASSRPIF